MEKIPRKIPGKEARKYLRLVKEEEPCFEEVAEDLGKTVFGQKEACTALSRVVSRFEAGMTVPHAPAGAVLFLGPVGVGKKEMARAISERMFGCSDSGNMKMFDCGYEDGLSFNPSFLEEKNIIVFAGIEKAPLELWKMLLSVVSSGRLGIKGGDEDGMGELFLDFSNSLIILTMNVGIEEERVIRKMGFGAVDENRKVQKSTSDQLMECFGGMPELVARLDEMVVFEPLTRESYENIYWKLVEEMNDCLEGVVFSTTDRLTVALIEEAVDDGRFGAKDMERVVRKRLFLPLSNVLATTEIETNFLVGDLGENGEVEFLMK
jgi:ATP-dependent Clp protease ATP-binding subunit ClpA